MIAPLANLLHDADDGVPVAFFVKVPELQLCTNRGAPWEIAIGKGLVDNRDWRLRTPVGDLKEAAFAQARADGRELIASHHTKERNLPWENIPGLAGQQIERRLIGGCQWNARNCASMQYARDCADAL